MPHMIEYSGKPDLDTRALMRTVQDAAIGDGSLFPLAGARTRAVRIDDCLIVDGHPDNAFVHVLLRIGHGRSDAQKSALGERRALTDAMAAQMAARPLGLSLQIEEADPVLNYKLNNYRDYLKARGAARAARRAPCGRRGAQLPGSWRRWAKPRTPRPTSGRRVAVHQTRQHHAQDGTHAIPRC